MRLIKIEKIREKPAIVAFFEVSNGEFLSISILREGKHFTFTLSNGEQQAEFRHGTWREWPTRKFKRKAEVLGYKLSEKDIELLNSLLISDSRSTWLETWEAPEKEGGKEEEELERRARELLKDPLLLQKIRTVLDFKLAGQGRKKLALFLILTSKHLRNPKERVSTCVYGKWGEGKSYLVEKDLELFEFIRMNSATLASVYRDSLKDPRYYDGKILYFGDIGDDISDELKEVFDLFKQLVTEGRVVKKLVMDVGGESETVELILEGYPILVWTAQAPPSDEHILSRVLPLEPDSSERQRRLIQEYDSYTKELPEEMIYPPEYKELERVVRKAIQILEKEALPVINPFARLINSAMSIHSPNINRDRQKFFGIVHALTNLHQFQRAKIDVGGKKYVVVSPLDVINALYLVGEDFKALFGALDNISQRAYRIIKEKVEPITKPVKELEQDASDFSDPDLRREANIELKTKGFTNEDLAEWLHVSPKTAWRITKVLYGKGFLDRRKEGRTWKYYLLPEYIHETRTNGIVLFDSQRILEGVLGGKELREWCDRYGFSIPPEEEGVYSIDYTQLETILTPEARVFEYSLIPPWDHLEIELMKPPFTFKQWLEKSNILREHKRTSGESSQGKINEGDKKAEIVKEEGTVFFRCSRCGTRFLSEADGQAHLETARKHPEVCQLKKERDYDLADFEM